MIKHIPTGRIYATRKEAQKDLGASRYINSVKAGLVLFNDETPDFNK